jgi:hypothetical protein
MVSIMMGRRGKYNKDGALDYNDYEKVILLEEDTDDYNAFDYED